MGHAGTIATVGALGLVLAGLVVVIIVVVRRQRPQATGQNPELIQQQFAALRQETATALATNTQAVNQQLADQTSQLNQRLAELNHQLQDTTGLIGKRLDAAGRTVQQVSTSLGELSKATDRVLEVGKDISSLQDILRAPKLRGIVGEYFLGDLLKQLVPSNYELQHRFESGEAVDAIVRLSHRVVPIDAKFPLEDFQRLTAESDKDKRAGLRRKFLAAVRKHVDAVSKKYILPDEGTFDFALMYIPAENVYYETIIKDSPDETSISEYALTRRVIPVSPNSLYAYLQAIVLGLRGFEIEKRAGEILKHLGRLQQEYRRFHDEYDVLGTHLKNAHNKYDDASRRLEVFEQKLAVGTDTGAPTPDPEELGRN